MPGARVEAQVERMKDLESRDVCAFCAEYIETETVSRIELETEHWVVKMNDYPYKNTKYHFLIISKPHVKAVSELSEAARSEFLNVVNTVGNKYKLKYYAVGLRSGDMRYNGGTVEHLHGHLIVGDHKKASVDPVRFKVGS
jgi:ATP adenylyltransferase